MRSHISTRLLGAPLTSLILIFVPSCGSGRHKTPHETPRPDASQLTSQSCSEGGSLRYTGERLLVCLKGEWQNLSSNQLAPDNFLDVPSTCRVEHKGKLTLLFCNESLQPSEIKKETCRVENTANGLVIACDGHEIALAHGEKGLQGERGAVGLNGPQGPQGEEGLPGPRGPRGKSGTLQGPKGERGPQGAKGDLGRPGPRGERGSVGQAGIGDRGSQGPQGERGDPGPRGTPGLPGIGGPRGAEGSEGSCRRNHHHRPGRDII